jgi:tetratricopeptide (TPR) repeat protein
VELLNKKTKTYYLISDNPLDTLVNPKYLVKTYNLSGKIKKELNKKENYQKELKKAIKLYRQLKKEEIILKDSIGKILKDSTGQVMKAIFTDSETDKEAATSYILLGDYYKEKEKNESAKTNYHKALNIYTELNKIDGIEIEVQSQYLILLELMKIYDNENKQTMVKKCFDRINLLKNIDIDSTITRDPEINLQEAIYYMQNGKYSEAGRFYVKALEIYKKNPNQKLIETQFLIGLNKFYAKLYRNASESFSQVDNLLKDTSIVLMKTDSMRLTVLCMAAKGIAMKKMGDKRNGIDLYNNAKKSIKNDEVLNKDGKLLKDMAHLKKYGRLKTVDIIIKSVGGAGGFAIVLIMPLLL